MPKWYIAFPGVVCKIEHMQYWSILYMSKEKTYYNILYICLSICIYTVMHYIVSQYCYRFFRWLWFQLRLICSVALPRIDLSWFGRIHVTCSKFGEKMVAAFPRCSAKEPEYIRMSRSTCGTRWNRFNGFHRIGTYVSTFCETFSLCSNQTSFVQVSL